VAAQTRWADGPTYSRYTQQQQLMCGTIGAMLHAKWYHEATPNNLFVIGLIDGFLSD
jgi:hypothetical protein